MATAHVLGAVGGFWRLSDLTAWLECPRAIVIQRCQEEGIALLDAQRGSQCCIAIADLHKLMRPLDAHAVQVLIDAELVQMQRQWMTVHDVWLQARQRYPPTRIPYRWFIAFIKHQVPFHRHGARGWIRVRPQHVWPTLERHLTTLPHR